jgi:cytochrome P450
MTTSSVTAPPHVPVDRIIDFDFFNVPAPHGDLHEGWHRLNAAPDVFWTPRNGGHWVATRGELIKEVYSDHARFSSRYESIPADTQLALMPPVTLDPPAHDAYRNLIAPNFTPKAIAALSDRVRELTVTLIEKFRHRGECEFVSEFALQMPVGVFLGLVDLPMEDRPLLLKFAETLTRASDAHESQQAFEGIANYLRDKLAARRRNPGADLLSRIVNAKIDGQPISDEASMGTCIVILTAGLDTVASTLGFVTRFLAGSPPHRRQLIEHPELLPQAVEELLRRFGVANLARVVRHDMDWRGVHLQAGDMILLSAPLGNLDARMFPDPLTVDFTRRDAGNNVSFGAGPHRCVGSFLARNELRIFLEEWLARIPEFAIKPGELVRVKSGKVNTVHYLPLVWKV